MAFVMLALDPDTMYWDQAMREPDRDKFLKAAQAEVDSHTKNGLWEIVKRSTVPKGALILRSVWAMKRKQRIFTQERGVQVESQAHLRRFKADEKCE